MEIQEQSMTFFKPKWQAHAKLQPHPARRWCHTSIAYRNYLFILGGRLAQNAKSKEYIYRLNLQTYQCEQIILANQHTTIMRQSHSLSIVNDSIYVLFGMNKAGKVLNDCLKLDITSNNLIMSRKQQKNKIQAKQSHMSIVLDNRFILIYGGTDSNEKQSEDFYIFDIIEETWKNITQITGHVIPIKLGGVLMNIKNQIFLFGGQGEIQDQNQYSNQIYKIQIQNYNQKAQNIKIHIQKLNPIGARPQPRSQFASVTYKDRYFIVLGGECATKEVDKIQNPPVLMNDIWAFDTQRNIWEELIVQNNQIFKPRSSFTATIYKQSLIVFGGLVSFKDFKTTDELFILHLNTNSDKRPLCNICKSSYRPVQRIQPEVERPVTKITQHKYLTGFSTIYTISQMIKDPFQAIGSLLHCLDLLQIQNCHMVYDYSKLGLYVDKLQINQFQWKEICQAYDYVPLIQQSDPRIQRALKMQIQKNRINYFSYNLKNCCFRLGSEFLITWMNTNQQLQLCLFSKFGIFHTTSGNINHNIQQNLHHPSHVSIILQFLRENNLQIEQFLDNAMSIIVCSIKNFNNKGKQIVYDMQRNDIFKEENAVYLKDFLKIYFSNQLKLKMNISSFYIKKLTSSDLFHIGFKSVFYLIQFIFQFITVKQVHEGSSDHFFQKICSYSSQSDNLILIYKNNKLMHRKELKNQRNHSKNENNFVYEFHLTKNTQNNLTFTNVIPSNQLLKEIKSFMKDEQNRKFKRKMPVGGFDDIKQTKQTHQMVNIMYQSQNIIQQDNLITKKSIKRIILSTETEKQSQQKLAQIQNFPFKE